MRNYIDIAYSFYRQAEENMGSGKAVENLVQLILKEIEISVNYGRTDIFFNVEDYLILVVNDAVTHLREIGFEVSHDYNSEEDELYISWDYSEEDGEAEE